MSTPTKYPESVEEVSGKKAGTVMTVEFELNGQTFTAINGGPAFQFTQAISFVIPCENQQEVDEMWEKLSAGGEIQDCGWVIDKYGVAWQVTPTVLLELISNPDKAKVDRVMKAMLKMKKLDIETLEKAA